MPATHIYRVNIAKVSNPLEGERRMDEARKNREIRGKSEGGASEQKTAIDGINKRGYERP